MHLTDITKELFREKTRIVLTILALAWGTFTIASMLAIGEGLRTTFAQAVAKTGRNVMLVSGGKTTREYKGTHSNMKINLRKRDYKSISRLPNVKSISPMYAFGATLRFGQNSTTTQMQAVAPNFAAINEIALESGSRFVNNNDIKNQSSVLVLGAKAVEELFTHGENPLGKKVLIAGKPFLIVGVAKKKAELVVVETPSDYLNWMPYTTYELLANPNTMSAVSITYRDAKHLEVLKKQIQNIVALNNSADPGDEGVVDLKDIAEQQSAIETFFVGMQIFLGILGLLTLLIAGIGIANVMYASIRRSSHEIGIRMALGAQVYHILSRYIVESLIVTFIGGFIGMVMTLAFVLLIKVVPMSGELIDVLGRPEPKLSALVILIVVLVLGLIGFLAGFFPALKASRIAPAEALIYE